MSDPQAELRIRLVIDDQSAAVVEKLKAGLDAANNAAAETEEAVKKAVGGGDDSHVAKGTAGLGRFASMMSGLRGGVGAVAVGFAAVAGGALLVHETVKATVNSMFELGSAAIEAAANARKQDTSVANYLMLLDQGKHSMTELKAYAVGVNDEFEELEFKFGLVSDELTSMFNTIISRGNISTEAAKELTEQMAIVGRVVPGGMNALAQGFAGMEMGMVRAQNPLVQLIAATHVLKGNAHAVAAELQKMAPEKQMAIANEAIQRQAKAMGAGGGGDMNMARLQQSLSNMREKAVESLGQPILDKLLPPLNRLQRFLLENRDAVFDFADKVGVGLGQAIELTADAAHAAYEVFRDNWASIRAIGKDLADPIRDAWRYVTDHKVDIVNGVRAASSAVVDSIRVMIDAIHGAKESVLDLIATFRGFAHGTTMGSTERHADIAFGSLQTAAGGMDDKAFRAALEKWQTLADVAGDGETRAQIEATTTRMQAYHDKIMQVGEAMAVNAQAGNLDAFREAYSTAVAQHNDAMQSYAIDLLIKSDALKTALVDGSLVIGEGFDDIIRQIRDKSPEVADALQKMKNPLEGKGIKGQGPTVNFNGGQTFNIKQDFRNQDPDRIAILFRRDLVKAAAARTQGRLAGPFGL